jgi:hypothetical protein
MVGVAKSFGKAEWDRISWQGSVLAVETTLHQLSPYVGKMKSSMARSLVEQFSQQGDVIYDPFCGSGSVALESWISGRAIIATDLNPYAVLLTRAKLAPPPSVSKALEAIDKASAEVLGILPDIKVDSCPRWVRSFFHPKTFREILAWCQVLQAHSSPFLLSCLLGILHHQRPGFLSYPSSHTVPYLRRKKFPREEFPKLYEYRAVKDRLERKVIRALKRVPLLDFRIPRECHATDAAEFIPRRRINGIITSPPYMHALDYARDNRLRLWFLGCDDWLSLDRIISPPEEQFLGMLRACLALWREVLLPGSFCVLVLGDVYSRTYRLPLPAAIARLAREVGGYKVILTHTERIPENRRVRRSYKGSIKETILAFRKV